MEQQLTAEKSQIEADSTPTVDYLAKLVVMSYRLSQGSGDLQKELFKFLHKVHPDWKVDPEVRGELFGVVYARVSKFLGPLVSESTSDQSNKGFIHTKYIREVLPINTSSIKTDLATQFDYFEDILNGEPNESNPVPAIAEMCIKRDYRFIAQEVSSQRVRENLKESALKTPVGDPWMSYFCHYGLLGNSIGIPEYDQMFTEVKDHVQNYPKRLPYQYQIDAVVRQYNLHHEVQAKIN